LLLISFRGNFLVSDILLCDSLHELLDTLRLHRSLRMCYICSIGDIYVELLIGGHPERMVLHLLISVMFVQFLTWRKAFLCCRSCESLWWIQAFMIIIQDTSCAQGHSVIKSAVVKGTYLVCRESRQRGFY
jgi:hypothetical protein